MHTEVVIKRTLSMKLRRTTIGCGVQGDDCLALAVSGGEGAWRIEWGLLGKMDDPAYARQLSHKVWRRPLWAPPLDRREAAFINICGIDLSFGGNDAQAARLTAKEIRAALRTQTLGRIPHGSDSVMLCGLEMRGEDGERHLVGAATAQGLIQHSYADWHERMGILHPHVGSSAAALANAYLALYPAARRRKSPLRLLALEGREITLAILLDDWRLLDAIQFRMMEGQRLDTLLLQQWTSFFGDRNHLEDAPTPCVIAYDGAGNGPASFETWSPFADADLVHNDFAVQDVMRENPDLAALAFGMALQGA